MHSEVTVSEDPVVSFRGDPLLTNTDDISTVAAYEKQSSVADLTVLTDDDVVSLLEPHITLAELA